MTNWICVSCVSASLTLMWLYFDKKKRKNNTKVLFYDPLSNTSCQCRHHFNIECPFANCSSLKTKEIINCLQNAKKSIDVCVYTISNEPIASTVIAAYLRGVQVRCVVSNCILLNSKEIQQFKSIGIKVKYQSDSQNSYMHQKFSIVDSTWLIHGSMNWTHQATFDNWESVLITDIPSLVNAFSEGFEKTWTTIS